MNAISRSGLGDHVARLFGRRPYACRWCRRRFRARARGVEVLAPVERAQPDDDELGPAEHALPHDDEPGPLRSSPEEPPAVVEVTAGADRRSIQRR